MRAGVGPWCGPQVCLGVAGAESMLPLPAAKRWALALAGGGARSAGGSHFLGGTDTQHGSRPGIAAGWVLGLGQAREEGAGAGLVGALCPAKVGEVASSTGHLPEGVKVGIRDQGWAVGGRDAFTSGPYFPCEVEEAVR